MLGQSERINIDCKANALLNIASSIQASEETGKEDERLPIEIAIALDVSGSMMGEPLAVATSLGMYLAERTKGEFRDMFLTFSENPELVKLQGDSVMERLRRISKSMMCRLLE